MTLCLAAAASITVPLHELVHVGARAALLTCRIDQADALLHELFRRIVFSLAVNNTDDYGRNHGFLRNNRGWVLSPAFDINPNPNTVALRFTSIGGARERGEGITRLLEEAGAFRLDQSEAQNIVSEVAAAVSGWLPALIKAD